MEQLLEHEVGIQSQILSQSLLSIQCRVEVSQSFKYLLEEKRNIIRTWSLRGAMHLMRTVDAALLWNALSIEWFTRWGTYLHQHVTEYQKQLISEAVLCSLSNRPKTREQLKNDLKHSLNVEHSIIDYLLSAWGGILKDLSYKRLVIQGELINNEVVFHLTTSWLNKQPDVFEVYDQEEALGIILLRYLNAYGPAKIEDFAYWSGITVNKAKKIVSHMSSELICIGDLYDNKNICPVENTLAEEIVILLPKFDSFLLGHKEKFYLDQAHYKKVFSGAGNINAPVILNGRVLGTWSRKGKKISCNMFEAVDEHVQSEINREVTRLQCDI
nr:crosslink repair DNA glycosylase YcaQ family protein [Paenibacillus thiaminolyticus]